MTNSKHMGMRAMEVLPWQYALNDMLDKEREPTVDLLAKYTSETNLEFVPLQLDILKVKAGTAHCRKKDRVEGR